MRRLGIAISGHRLNQLSPSERPRLEAEVARVFDLIAECGRKAANARIAPRVLTALAEGTDRMGAEAALQRGWRMTAPLPFEPEEYEKDFAHDVSREQFRAFLAAADRVSVARHKGARTMGYVAANGILLRGADVLVALWNGAPPKGPGGTAEFMARAAAAGRAVIWVATEPGGETALVAHAPGRSFRARLSAYLARSLPTRATPEAMRRAESM